jgi:hypothetical protein
VFEEPEGNTSERERSPIYASLVGAMALAREGISVSSVSFSKREFPAEGIRLVGWKRESEPTVTSAGVTAIVRAGGEHERARGFMFNVSPVSAAEHPRLKHECSLQQTWDSLILEFILRKLVW